MTWENCLSAFTDTVWSQPAKVTLHAQDSPAHRDEAQGREEQPRSKKGMSWGKPPGK